MLGNELANEWDSCEIVKRSAAVYWSKATLPGELIPLTAN